MSFIVIVTRFMIVTLTLVLMSCQDSVTRLSKPLLGTIVNVTAICDVNTDQKTIQAAFDEMERIESVLSPYRPGSDLYRLNHTGDHGKTTVSVETYDLIKKSVDISIETDGCFDITFASIAHLWNYKNENFIPPAASSVTILLPLVNSRNVMFYSDTKSIAFARPGMKVGLGAIAKGYAVGKAISELSQLGVDSAIVEAGGDLQVIGSKHGKPWITGLRHPRKNAIILTIDLNHMDAVATSGDYERFKMIAGRRYHHILDPRTGYPADTFSSVTVVSKNAALSDAYATAIFVMGLDKSREFLKRHSEIDVVLADQSVNLYISRRLKSRIKFLDVVKTVWL